MKSGVHASTFAALSFLNSKKYPVYCWVDKGSFPVPGWLKSDSNNRPLCQNRIALTTRAGCPCSHIEETYVWRQVFLLRVGCCLRHLAATVRECPPPPPTPAEKNGFQKNDSVVNYPDLIEPKFPHSHRNRMKHRHFQSPHPPPPPPPPPSRRKMALRRMTL